MSDLQERDITEVALVAVARALSEAGGASDWDHALECAEIAIDTLNGLDGVMVGICVPGEGWMYWPSE